ncbi:Mis6-domain-containing protein [Zopfia rhizophila CBS 207.26]|uniref:Mis6-domain-containing protein n=1 Tax=Zopfia rhizophila CBS 207.26 TaxID=1314779 RepID=A0A6A6DT87_9PEZI|nr:Mis6-domain-containing protein [Zopfia rhizophila CBS 207.26]
MPSVTDKRASPASLQDAVEALQSASRTPAKQRTVKVSGVVDAICGHAFEGGLDADSLQTLVEIVATKTELDQTSATTLIKNLYPAQRVPTDVVITAVGGLGQGKGKASLGTQNGLVKWLTIVYEVLEDPKILSRLYGVLFGMLDMISIRTSLCHLLSLITRRRHVKPFRIQQLLELSRGLGNEPALQGLLRIYKDYYPDIILGSATTSQKSFPPRPDSEWRMRLLAIQEASARTSEGLSEQHDGFRVLRKGPKRSKVSVIPDLHTFYANETSVTLEEIDNVEDFVEKLDRIELPGQLISFLIDPLLQKYLTLKPSVIASRRIDLWLSMYLEEEYQAAKCDLETSTHLSEILGGLLKQTQYTKSILPIVSTFLKAYLLVWDGVKDADTLLGILSHVPLQPFQDAHLAFFGPAENALQKSAIGGRNPEAYEKLLKFYTDILRHWMTMATPQSAHTSNGALSSPDQKYLNDLVTHVSDRSLSILLSSSQDANSALISSIVSFYEILSLSSRPTVIPIILPPPHLIYLLVQSPSQTTLSRICGILANYKIAFDSHPTPIGAYYPAPMTNRFNGYLMDVCNLLWRSRALTFDNNSLGCFCNSAVREILNTHMGQIDREYGIAFAFGLPYNACLASMSAAAWRSLEEAEIQKEGYDPNAVNRHKGPVGQRSLVVLAKNGGVDLSWKQYRVYVLNWMNERGYGGIKDLMFATMTGLKESG